jgi:hypothetical protein
VAGLDGDPWRAKTGEDPLRPDTIVGEMQLLDERLPELDDDRLRVLAGVRRSDRLFGGRGLLLRSLAHGSFLFVHTLSGWNGSLETFLHSDAVPAWLS